MDTIFQVFKDKIKGEKALKIIVFLGILGIALIMVSEFWPKGEKASQSAAEASYDAQAFQQEMEGKLEQLLSEISGVGKAKVMLTVSSTEEYVYAEEVKQSGTDETDRTSSQSENKYVILDSGEEKEALVKKVMNPQINGVVIVCEGGGSAKVCESIYRTVSTVLGIPINKIYVTQIKTAK